MCLGEGCRPRNFMLQIDESVAHMLQIDESVAHMLQIDESVAHA